MLSRSLLYLQLGRNKEKTLKSWKKVPSYATAREFSPALRKGRRLYGLHIPCVCCTLLESLGLFSF